MDDSRGDGRLLAVHGRDVAEAEESVAVARVADRAFHYVASPESMAADLLLRHENVFRIGEEVVLRGPQEAMPLADDFKAARGEHRATVREIPAYRGEDELVLAVGAKFLWIGARHHALDNRRRRPCLDVGEAVFGKIGVAVRVRGNIGLLGARLRRERSIEKRIHALFAVCPANWRIVGLRAAAKVLAAAVVEPLFLAIVAAAPLLLRLGLLGLRRWRLGDGARKHIEFF